jgi:hypothetical protein
VLLKYGEEMIRVTLNVWLLILLKRSTNEGFYRSYDCSNYSVFVEKIKGEEKGWKIAAAIISIFVDHQKGYLTLTFEDLKYLATRAGYKHGWAIYKAKEYNIEITR